tara:strand:- start:7656 stop:8306 length:651 start_codon:yes stop_codon:yes gene_type:complete
MKPIPSPISKEALDLMNKAQFMIERIDTLEKKLEMVEHEGKKIPAFAADGKGEKDMKVKASMDEKNKYCMKNFGKKYSECSAKEKAQCDKVHGKVEKGKGEKCPECGEGMNKMGCMKMGCKMYGGKMEKAQPNYKVSYNTNPQENMFVVESGGQTRSAYYTTNQHLLDSQDVANKGASSFSVDFKTLASQMNPHEGGGADRLDVEGKISKSNNSPY